MAAPLKTIGALRLTAKLLLAVTPLMVLSGFLTAKPFLLESLGFATARLLHTIAVPALFVPLLVVHSTAGILFLVSRSKRYNTSAVKLAAGIGWAGGLAVLSLLYFVGQPSGAPRAGEAAQAAASSTQAGGPDAGARAEAGPEETAPAAPRGDARAVAASDAEAPPVAQGAEKQAQVEDPPPPAKPPRPGQLAGNRKQGAGPSKASPEAGPEPERQPALDGSRLVAERCAGCHPLSTVTATKRTPEQWREVVGRMVRMGAKLDADEQEAVLRYLVSRFPSPPSQ